MELFKSFLTYWHFGLDQFIGFFFFFLKFIVRHKKGIHDFNNYCFEQIWFPLYSKIVNLVFGCKVNNKSIISMNDIVICGSILLQAIVYPLLMLVFPCIRA